MKRTLRLGLVLLTVSAFAQSASMFRSDVQHTGVYGASGVVEFKKVKWKFHTEGGIFSSPVVVNGVVYFGSTDHNLYALDQGSGALKWRFATKSRVTSSPAVVGSVVYFGSYDGNFYAVDASAGKEKWHFQTGGERRYTGRHLHGIQPVAETMPDPFDLFLSSPVVVDGVVYFGSGDGNVYALNAANGDLKWKFQTGDVVHGSPAFGDGLVLIGSFDSYFYALDAALGKEKWRFKTGEDPVNHNQVGIQSSAAVADGTVYFGCRDSHLYALDLHTGEKKWAIDTKGSWVVSSPAVREGKVYFVTSDSGLFYAVDGKSGTPLFSLSSNKWYMYSSPAVAGNMVYFGTSAGKLMAVDLGTQQYAWTFETDGSRQNGTKLTKPDGTPNYEAAYTDDFYDDMVIGMHKMLTVGSIMSSPFVADNVIYVGSADGTLYALM